MNNEIERAKQEIREAQEKLQSAQDRLAKAENKTGWGFWMPEEGGMYFSIDSCGYFDHAKFDMGSIDTRRIQQNNIFKTEEDAERKLRIENELREIAGEVDYGKDLYSIAYNKIGDIIIDVLCEGSIQFGNIVSNDSGFCKKAIEQIGMDDLKWFYSYGWRRV